ncbi:MAG: IclR family transcriptional regulator [Rhodospirillales bacterium]|nr:IclR family transcriptional regulator [Rhodospirillales bacterium]MDE2197987.1 IclR family transcriptional regulator [Rhodospirillales bacterium]MDE2576460.1 IclR family transcriptional regulator [Rhodospirillales bacterium]
MPNFKRRGNGGTAVADTASPKNVVGSLAKGFRVLEAFTAEAPELVLAEVARRAGHDNATAFRLLNTLVMLGYVEKVPGTRAFRLTLKCLDLGFHAIARSDLRTLARPILRNLVGEVNEAASIGVLEGADVLYVERMQAGLARLGVDIRIGSRVPVHSTAIGHAILAHMPRATQISVLDARPREKLTEHTLTDLDALLARLDQVRARGYAVSDQENVSGLRVVSAPVLGPEGTPVAGLSVAAPGLRMPLAAFELAAAGPVLAAARDLSRALHAAGGFAAPSPKP